MKEKHLWTMIAALIGLVFGQAFYISRLNADAMTQYTLSQPGIAGVPAVDQELQLQEFQRWSEKIKSLVNQGSGVPEKDFDAYFNDNFFATRSDPFAEIERTRQKIMGQLAETKKAAFDYYWSKWYKQRLAPGEMKTSVTETPGEITLVVLIPGVGRNIVDINILRGRIKISYTLNNSSQGGMNAAFPGNVKLLPIPPGANPVLGIVQRDGEEIRIVFGRNAAP